MVERIVTTGKFTRVKGLFLALHQHDSAIQYNAHSYETNDRIGKWLAGRILYDRNFLQLANLAEFSPSLVNQIHGYKSYHGYDSDSAYNSQQKKLLSLVSNIDYPSRLALDQIISVHHWNSKVTDAIQKNPSLNSQQAIRHQILLRAEKMRTLPSPNRCAELLGGS